ncbi:F-box/kelch-repeat protein, partial [Trifolium medium]|nr:F-box/kelch-repeat protein [Trifolium medium]
MGDNYQSSTAKCHQQPPRFLPEELIIQILLRLPVRSLLEFKCVCKSWKTRISDPKFAKSHLEILTVNPSITHQHIFSSHCISKPCKIVSFPLQPLLENPSKPTKPAELCMENKFLIFGSCNGLLCLFDIVQ